MKTGYFIVVVLFAGLLFGACSGEAKKEGNANVQQTETKQMSNDTTVAGKRVKRGQDLVVQAEQLGTIYCNCTQRRADSTRRACMEKIQKAVTTISTNLTGDEKTAFDAKYSEKTASCK